MGNQPNDETQQQAPAVNADGIPAPSGETNLIDTDYVVGQDNFSGQFTFSLDIHSKVFLISAGTILLFVLLTLALQDQAAAVFTSLRGWVTSKMAWFFISAANIFVLLCLVLIFTPLGKVRIGGKDAIPDYSYVGWFAMLFAAGMGIGLMFYGVAEPMGHFSAAFDGIAIGETGARTTGHHWVVPKATHGRRCGWDGSDHLPLGPAPLGDLRHRCAGSGDLFTTRACR